MPSIIDLLPELTNFPGQLDIFPSVQDGNTNANVTSANIVNQIEGVTYATETYNQQTVQYFESMSVTGDRKRVTIQSTLVLNAGPSGSLPYYQYSLQLTAAQMQFLSGIPFQAGNIILVQVVGSTGTNAYRSIATPSAVDTLQIYMDNVDTNKNVPSDTYYISLTIIGS